MSAVTLALLFFLSVALNEQVTEGCRCRRRHPQQHFCGSDIVIRAKVTGKVPNADPELVAYNIQTIKIFKQSNNKEIKFLYSSTNSCGFWPDNGEYLLTGEAGENGGIFVHLCNYVKGWKYLSPYEQGYLNMYQKGCRCQILPCTGESCLSPVSKNQCLLNNDSNGYESALQSICLPGSDGVCSWQKILVN